MTFRLRIETQCVATLETLIEQASLQSHRQKVVGATPHGRKLAVVGSAPSLAKDIEALSAWDGDIWAINYAGRFLAKHAIGSVFVSVDPLPLAGLSWVDKALIASSCHPSVFDQLRESAVTVFDVVEVSQEGIAGGITTATRMPSLAFKLGYLDVSFFGCDGSYEFDGTDHAGYHNGEPEELIVRAGGEDFRIETGLLVQCEQLATLITTFPDVFKNRSRGLLAAMLEHPDSWEVVGVSRAMKAHLEKVNGPSGLYDSPYVPRPAAEPMHS